MIEYRTIEVQVEKRTLRDLAHIVALSIQLEGPTSALTGFGQILDGLLKREKVVSLYLKKNIPNTRRCPGVPPYTE